MLHRSTALVLISSVAAFAPSRTSFHSPRKGRTDGLLAARQTMPTVNDTVVSGYDDISSQSTATNSFTWNNTLATQEISDLSSFIASTGASDRHWNVKSLPDVDAAVIVPGFLTGQEDFVSMAESLTRMGIPAVVVPMPSWHWLPVLGGRSVRPILDRIDFAVRHLAAVAGHLTDLNFERVTTDCLRNIDDALRVQDYASFRADEANPQSFIPGFEYSLFDCCHDILNNPGESLQSGMDSSRIRGHPAWNPRGHFPTAPEPMGRVALIGHSAGGWISRAYLSQRAYGGKVYGGQDLVHTLVTLGSPHAVGPWPVFKGVEWVNSEVLDASSGVRALAVGGTGYRGDSSGPLTRSSYAFCCPMGSDGAFYDGDGVTPLECALAMNEFVPHADTLVLDDVGHFCWSDVLGCDILAPELAGRRWYGDEDVVQQWAAWL